MEVIFRCGLVLAVAVSAVADAQVAAERCVVPSPLPTIGDIKPTVDGRLLLAIPGGRRVELVIPNRDARMRLGPQLSARAELESVGATGELSDGYWVFDDRADLVAQFSLRGILRRAMSLTPPAGMRFAAMVDSRRALWLPEFATHGRRESEAGRVAMIADADGSDADTLLQLSPAVPRVQVAMANATIEVPNWFDDSPVVAVSPRASFLVVVDRRISPAVAVDSLRVTIIDLRNGGTERRAVPYRVRQVPAALLDSLVTSEAAHLSAHVGHDDEVMQLSARRRILVAALPAYHGWRTVASALVDDDGDVYLEREYTDSRMSRHYQRWRRGATAPVPLDVPANLRVRAVGNGSMYAVSRARDENCAIWRLPLGSGGR